MTTSNQYTELATSGKMTKKLLNKTLNYYFFYALSILLVVGPVFYITSDIFFDYEADEDLSVLKNNFFRFTKDRLKADEIKLWNSYNHDQKIEKFNGINKDTLFDRSFYDALNKDNEPFRVLQSPLEIEGKRYTFSTRINMIGKENLLVSTVSLFIILLLLLILGFFVIIKIISNKIWKPFYKTLGLIEQFEIDKNFNSKLPFSSIEEFNRLNNALNKLIERNTLIYKSQKEFIENAAHELQTPIAIFKGKLETLLQYPDITKEQFTILDNLNDTTNRLNRLNKNLLLLSKIESKQYNIPENVLLDEVIKNQMDFFKEQAIAKNIHINTVLEPNCLVKANLFLSEIMIKNLFLNAINHNVKNGSITIQLDKDTLVFSNTGKPEPLQTDKLFERFSKVDPSSKGNGLGLSIIKKIAENNDWEIHYYFKNELHVFEIQFFS